VLEPWSADELQPEAGAARGAARRPAPGQPLPQAPADLRTATAAQLERQVAHWVHAASRLSPQDLASAEAWGRLEQYLGISLQRHLGCVVASLRDEAQALAALQRAARSPNALADLQRRLLAFRRRYLRIEITLDFFADALNTRTNARIAALLRACDTLAHRSMAQLLDALGKPAPPALTYLDKGLGASILKAGLRLWDGGQACPVAAIKITHHNLLRPTSLIHEAGHQVAHVTGWNEELAAALARQLPALGGAPQELADVWAGWASEIAADAFAFVHTGYASVAALHDVLACGPGTVFRYLPHDPHPVGYLRVLLGVETCRYFYGPGPWDDLAQAWTAQYPIEHAPGELRRIAQGSQELLKAVVHLALDTSMRAFGGRSLRALVPPERVSPAALQELESRIGPALFSSAHWLWSEPLRITALTGLRLALQPGDLPALLDQQEQAMLRLGGALPAA
jgi:hypothetical protein